MREVTLGANMRVAAIVEERVRRAEMIGRKQSLERMRGECRWSVLESQNIKRGREKGWELEEENFSWDGGQQAEKQLRLSFRSRLISSRWDNRKVIWEWCTGLGGVTYLGLRHHTWLSPWLLEAQILFGGSNNGAESATGGFKNGSILEKKLKAWGHGNPPSGREDLDKEVVTGKRGHSSQEDWFFFFFFFFDAFICFFPAGWVACAVWLRCCTTVYTANGVQTLPKPATSQHTVHKRGQPPE